MHIYMLIIYHRYIHACICTMCTLYTYFIPKMQDGTTNANALRKNVNDSGPRQQDVTGPANHHGLLHSGHARAFAMHIRCHYHIYTVDISSILLYSIILYHRSRYTFHDFESIDRTPEGSITSRCGACWSLRPASRSRRTSSRCLAGRSAAHSVSSSGPQATEMAQN